MRSHSRLFFSSECLPSPHPVQHPPPPLFAPGLQLHSPHAAVGVFEDIHAAKAALQLIT